MKLSKVPVVNAKVNCNYNKLFFLNSTSLGRPVDVLDDRSITVVSHEARMLSCKYCDRVFHKRFVLEHVHCDRTDFLKRCFAESITVLGSFHESLPNPMFWF